MGELEGDAVNPLIAGMRLSMLVHIYRVRLRSHAVQELLAGSGIAVGVALVLGVLVANTSITGSAGALVHQVVGSATLQLAARSPAGFDERLLARARRLPGVSGAAGVLRENVTVAGPRGRAAVALLGVTPSILGVGGLAPRGFGPGALRLGGGLILPVDVAATAGVKPGERATVLAAGRAREVTVEAVLGDALFGALASSPVAVALLGSAQRTTGRAGRVTQLLVRPRSGAEQLAAEGLRRLGAGRLDVLPATRELRLLEQAVAPNDQSTSLFAAISVMVGFLLALNAMLLTVPERRRFVADLRVQGYDRRQILVLLGFQAVTLGVAASAAGVLLGDLLSRAFLHRVPAYLVTAFPIGDQQALGMGTVLLALGCGVLATLLASLAPLLDLRPGRAGERILAGRGVAGEVIARPTTNALALIGVASLAAITAVVIAVPGLTIIGGVALALITLCLVPYCFTAVAGVTGRLAERVRSSALILVVSEMRATTTRAVALAGIAALAVYGSVSVGGARADLIRGLDANFSEYLQTADLWVTSGGNDLTTNALQTPGAAAALAAVRGVANVREYHGGFLDAGSRHLWIIARPPQDRPAIPASQFLRGTPAGTEALLRAGGWAAISNGVATDMRLHVGSPFALPTPGGTARLRVAAILTNLGWSPGAVILGAGDYRHYWPGEEPTAYEVSLRPGVSASAGRSAALRALSRWPGLGVQTFSQRRAQFAQDSRQGLHALSEISNILLLSAALAVASALSAALWQRRARLASMKIQGYGTGQLWRAMLLEAAIVLGVGCIVGAGAGVLGHALATRWLSLTTGFPAPFAIGFSRVFLTLALLGIAAIAVISLPGLAAARAPVRTSFQE